GGRAQKLLARHIIKPEMIYERVVEVDERVRADGTVEKEPDLAGLRAELSAARAAGINAVAIVFMHAYRYAAHEERVAALARELGFPQVSVSHEVSPLIKLVGRPRLLRGAGRLVPGSLAASVDARADTTPRPLSHPKSDLSVSGQLKVPNSGNPDFGRGRKQSAAHGEPGEKNVPRLMFMMSS